MREISKKLPLFALIVLVITGVIVPIISGFIPAKAAAATITGSWVDQDTIIIGSATGSHATYTLDSSSGNYVYSVPVPAGAESQNPNVSNCSNTISIVQVASPADSQGTIIENKWSSPGFLVNCEPLNDGKPQPITLTDTANASKTPDNSDDASKQIGCEAQLTDPLTWIICPVVNALGQVVNFVDNLITDQLDVKTNAIFCDTGPHQGTCQAYYAAWQSFRDIALGLMTIIGLAVIIAQALGLEILDAYTIRKALPRLLIAAIAITLSWPLMRFAINLSDDLGFGVRHLIYAPFSKLSDTVDLSFGGGVANQFFGFATGAAGAAAVPAWLLAGGAVSLLSFAGTAALAVLVAIIVLILRQIAIILLMLLAPLAIVAYILPNTQRIYRLWWESFSKALLMFPLIAAFIATGRVFSAIAVNNGQFINQIIGFVAYFAPYFMIPLTFRMAGSTVSGLGNFVQSRAQGGFGALSNLRGQQRKSRLERARGRGLYRRNDGLTGKLNKIGHYTLDADEQLPYKLGSSKRINKLTGGASGKLFGRIASEQAGKKGGQFAEHTAKAAEKAGLHYSGAWAALGMRNHLKEGMTEEGLKKMDNDYGIDKDGNRVKGTNNKAVAWKAPVNGDFHGLTAYGETLRQGSIDGSQAQYAGKELTGKAGILSSFGNDMETQRASLESVAAVSAARDGKLSAGDVSTMYNNMIRDAKGDPSGIAFAGAQMALLENSSTQQRPDVRRAKGIRIASDGQAYSVYSDKEVIQPDGNGKMVSIPAYASKEAEESLLTAKSGAIGGGKGDYYDETREAYVYHGGSAATVPRTEARDREGNPVMDEATGTPRQIVDISQLTPQQRELRKTLSVQAGVYSQGDPGAMVKLEKTMDAMGIDSTERQQYMMEYRAAEANMGGAEPPDGVPDPGGHP